MKLDPKIYGKVLLKISPHACPSPSYYGGLNIPAIAWMPHLAAQDQPFVFRHFSWHSSRFAVTVAMVPGMSNGPKLTW